MGGLPKGYGGTELSHQEKGQEDHTSPALPLPNRSGTTGSPRCFTPLTGNAVPSHLPAPIVGEPTHSAQQQLQTLLLAGRERFLQLSRLHFSPTGEVLQEPAQRAPSISQMFKPVLHISPLTPLILQPCHCCRTGRGCPVHRDPSRDFCWDHKGMAEANCLHKLRSLVRWTERQPCPLHTKTWESNNIEPDTGE